MYTLKYKLCCRCKIRKERVFFSKLSKSKDGLNWICKDCDLKRHKKRYQSLEGLASALWNSRKQIAKNSGLALEFDRVWFLNWLHSNPKYHQLYAQWKYSNYIRRLTPSIDRIDNSIGYLKNNIQCITNIENISKGSKSSPSTHPGVYFNKSARKWIVTFSHKGKKRYIGSFILKENAIVALETFKGSLENITKTIS